VKLRNDLAYINHYPPLQKYLSLFPPTDESADNKQIREQTYAKIIKTVRAKEAIRDKELFDADVKMTDEKATKANYQAVEADNFFEVVSEEEDEASDDSEKSF